LIPTEWLKLESDRIKRVKYVPNVHDERGDVLVEFNEGKVYRYADVPSHMVERMVHSSSPGEYFHNKIRSEYKPLKVTDDV
jgi:KTSC domain-containing protein